VCRKVYPKSYIDTTEKEFLLKKELYTSLPKEKVTIIAPSQWVAEEASKSFLGQYETKVIPNGVNIEIFKPRPIEEKLAVLNKYGIPTDKPIILGVASVWDERKQPGLFEKLADLAKDCTVLMAGLSKKQKNNLPKNVYGICRTENAAELACLYSAASVLLDPTLEDTFPLVPLEALACGTPVVTSPVCGCPEQVDHLTGIVLSNPTSVNEAYRAVCTVLDEQKKAASLSVKEADNILFTTELCRSRALALYDNYKMALRYVELAEEAL
jgi:glycosyltransferase involved in cell wall biosynthesis